MRDEELNVKQSHHSDINYINCPSSREHVLLLLYQFQFTWQSKSSLNWMLDNEILSRNITLRYPHISSDPHPIADSTDPLRSHEIWENVVWNAQRRRILIEINSNCIKLLGNSKKKLAWPYLHTVWSERIRTYTFIE